MAADLRQTGISVLGSVPWGTHFCLFYGSDHDLVDTLVPYFKAGLEGNEFCQCMLARAATEQHFKRALQRAVPDLDRYVANGAIEIVAAETVYVGGEVFDADHARHYQREKRNSALRAGFAGMRTSGDEAWLKFTDWPHFSEYERVLSDAMRGHRALALCVYSLETSRPDQMLDVAKAHDHVVVKRAGHWELLETAALRETKQELKALSDSLERRVEERTSELKEINEQLRKEIAQRKRIEQQLTEEEARYRSLFEISHDVVLFVDSAGGILDINPRGAQITGHTHDELRGMSVLGELVVPEDHGIMREMLAQVPDDQMWKYEVRWRTKHGRVIDFDGQSVARRSRDGKFISTFCCLRDITKRKQVERALIESEERFAKAFRASPVSNTITRAADGRFIDVNDAFVRMFGYEREEAVGRTPLELNLWIDPTERHLLMKTLKDKGTVQGFEARARTKSGEILELVRFVETIEVGGEECVLMSAYDQTRHKQAEQALRSASEQLQALSGRLVEIQEKERRQLARELHDRVGQGLTALGINLDIVKSKVAGKGDSEVTSRLEDSIALVEATADAIVNVLSELRPPMLDDLGLLPALEWYAKEFSTRTGIDVSVVGEDQMTRLAPEAEIALFRIAQEALNNVAKHARARHVDVELTSNGEFLLSVSDDGVGLDAHSQPESRAPTRFGMVTMRERALAIGGRFDISQRPGGGTSVAVRIPRHED